VEARAVNALLAWFESVARDLPWRRTRDPWKIIVSETMLQQTQVSRVLPKYLAFIERFPTVDVCAQAVPGDVIRMWDGLGYNRRALALHKAAQTVVADHHGVFPRTYDELLALPGVGPYTARAIAVFAYEDHYAVVDTNVARIVARAVANRTLNKAQVQQLADILVPEGDSWRWNQAMLDFGATVCTKRTPKCNVCPIENACAWRRNGGADPAIGSAGTSSKQSAFAGSDRQGRGRLIQALRNAPVPRSDLATVMGWTGDDERAARVLVGLLIEKLVVENDGLLTLP
jgi:A/G-specific adenine glycosylase